MATQLKLFGEEKIPEWGPVQWPEVDPMHLWRLALFEFDEKRFRQGWRPWHKKGKQNDSSDR